MLNRKSTIAIVAFSATAALLTGCLNIFDPLDSPTSDAQILSAARARFDDGDYAEALELYRKLGNNDSAEAETAFVEMNQAGITMSVLISSVRIDKGQSVGSILSNLAEAFARSGVSASTRREKLQSAYARVSGIENQQVRGFLRFLVAISAASQVLSENAGLAANGLLEKSDLVAVPTGCSVDALSCAADTDCAEPVAFPKGTADATEAAKYVSDTDTSVDLSTSTYMGLVNSILGASKGLTEMAVESGDSKTLTDQLNTYAVAYKAAPTQPTLQCLLAGLVTAVGVGR